MLHILYDGQVIDKVFNNYEEVLNFLINYYKSKDDFKEIIEEYGVTHMLDRTVVNGLSIIYQMELFKDIYNNIMEENISLIDGNGEFL